MGPSLSPSRERSPARANDRNTHRAAMVGEAEGGNADAVFLLEDGASLSNVIIGKEQIEGIHCLGSCTLKNVWWKAVCEDALALEGGLREVRAGAAAARPARNRGEKCML